MACFLHSLSSSIALGITNSRILLNGEALEMFEAAFESQIRSNNVTVAWFNNTM